MSEERTIASISDGELLERAVRHAIVSWGKNARSPNWSRVMIPFALGSTFATQLCARFEINPEGRGLPTPLPRHEDKKEGEG